MMLSGGRGRLTVSANNDLNNMKKESSHGNGR